MLNIILIAISLSMDTFALSLSYGLKKEKLLTIIVTAITVGLFHFFMPLIGNTLGVSLFSYTIINPKYVLFIVFMILSIDMFIHFFNDNNEVRPLNIIGTLLFSISVSFDSFSVGIGISYLYENVLLIVSAFCLISAVFTFLGFKLGEIISNKIGKYSFLLGSITLILYAVWVLTI
ncbi:MAG: manganese efflux pump [Bacilli bacterium]